MLACIERQLRVDIIATGQCRFDDLPTNDGAIWYIDEAHPA